MHILHKAIPLETLQAVNRLIETAPFTDGAVTAGYAARVVKRNLQIPRDSATAEAINKLLFEALQQNPDFQAVVFPKVLHSMLVSRYENGMAYGPHIDDALMTQQRLRTDVSVTIFLNEPSEYEGGELCIHPGYRIKLPKGSLVAYPSTSIHEVQPVVSGSRLVAVFWVQSLVRDPAHREILYDIDSVCKHMFQNQGKTPEYDVLAKTRANLLRTWVD